MASTALYVRVSTTLQSNGLAAQVLALKTYCEHNGIDDYIVYEDEGVSGAKSSRPGLDRMMIGVRTGAIKTVIVYSFSRMARSTAHLLNVLKEFNDLGVAFISISEKIDTSTPTGRMIYVVCAAVSELERELIVERVKNGLVNARSKGKRLGRPKVRNTELIIRLRQQGLTYREIAALAKCSTWAVHETLRLETQFALFTNQKHEIG